MALKEVGLCRGLFPASFAGRLLTGSSAEESVSHKLGSMGSMERSR
jgi:hypothetical protein